MTIATAPAEPTVDVRVTLRFAPPELIGRETDGRQRRYVGRATTLAVELLNL